MATDQTTVTAGDIDGVVDSLLSGTTHDAGRDVVAAGIIRNMRDALEDCLTFLADKPWGTIDYMEGSKVYSDIRDTQRAVRRALGVPQID